MCCICVEVVSEERAPWLDEMGEHPMSSSQRGLIADSTSQLLIGLGWIITSHPDVKSQVDARIGDSLISLGRKLHSPAQTNL